MPKAKKTEAKARPVKVKAKIKAAVSAEFRVVDANNNLIRVYTTEEHGKTAGELASAFIKKQREVFRKDLRIDNIPEPVSYPELPDESGDSKVASGQVK